MIASGGSGGLAPGSGGAVPPGSAGGTSGTGTDASTGASGCSCRVGSNHGDAGMVALRLLSAAGLVLGGRRAGKR
ncbi:MAG: hypothetical protein JXP73_22430 [Deltaproteobacteria bacterium]|nr:hypothetical protein [Deltaproteobacteria bacterium]